MSELAITHHDVAAAAGRLRAAAHRTPVLTSATADRRKKTAGWTSGENGSRRWRRPASAATWRRSRPSSPATTASP